MDALRSLLDSLSFDFGSCKYVNDGSEALVIVRGCMNDLSMARTVGHV